MTARKAKPVRSPYSLTCREADRAIRWFQTYHKFAYDVMPELQDDPPEWVDYGGVGHAGQSWADHTGLTCRVWVSKRGTREYDIQTGTQSSTLQTLFHELSHCLLDSRGLDKHDQHAEWIAEDMARMCVFVYQHGG